MYAEVGPQIRPVTVMPPASDSSVRYTSLIHDQSTAKDPTGIIHFGPALKYSYAASFSHTCYS